MLDGTPVFDTYRFYRDTFLTTITLQDQIKH